MIPKNSGKRRFESKLALSEVSNPDGSRRVGASGWIVMLPESHAYFIVNLIQPAR
jgi:hypothetical protein